MIFVYLNKVKSAGAPLNVKHEEAEHDHVALRLVDDPLADLVVGIRIWVVGRAQLTRPR